MKWQHTTPRGYYTAVDLRWKYGCSISTIYRRAKARGIRPLIAGGGIHRQFFWSESDAEKLGLTNAQKDGSPDSATKQAG